MNRNEALALLLTHLQNAKPIKHSLPVEVVMRGLARHFS